MILPEAISKKLFGIFMPYAAKKIQDFDGKQSCLAYYTTTDTAQKILENQEIWMRNTTAMNDYREVQYGITMINRLFNTPQSLDDEPLYTVGKRLRESLSGIFHEKGRNIFDEVLNKFCQEQSSWLFNTYIACFTEHDMEADKLGRLSMWRAYGGNNGVALVFNQGCRFQMYDNSRISLTPVAYLDDIDFATEVDNLTNQIIENREFLQNIDTMVLQGYLISLLRFAIVSIKHPGFREEREWRLVAHGTDLDCEAVTVKGIVQPISSFKLQLNDSSLFDVLHHIIIGPTPYDNVIHKAIVKILQSKCNISDAESRIFHSYIPYRQI